MLFIFLSRKQQQINPPPNPVMMAVKSFYADTNIPKRT